MTTTRLGPRATALAADAISRAAIRTGFIAAVDHANRTERTAPLNYHEAVLIIGETGQLVEYAAVYDSARAAVAARVGKVIAVFRGDRFFGADR